MSYVNARQMAIGNAEIRVPLSLLTRTATGAVPIDAFAFADAGHFSMPVTTAADAFARTIGSVGAGARLNAAGSIFQFGVARQLRSPTGGWAFIFDVRPGF
jgi:hypothetical protein